MWDLIARQIDSSAVGFFDLRVPNRNVAIELGYAIARRRPVILFVTAASFAVMPLSIKSIFSVVCAGGGDLTGQLTDFLDREWAPGMYDWASLEPRDTGAYFRRRTEQLILISDDPSSASTKECVAQSGAEIRRLDSDEYGSIDQLLALAKSTEGVLYQPVSVDSSGEITPSITANCFFAGLSLGTGTPLLAMDAPESSTPSDLTVFSHGGSDYSRLIEEFRHSLTTESKITIGAPSVVGTVERALAAGLKSGGLTGVWTEPGYGKTVLLAQVATRNAIWIRCDARTEPEEIFATVAQEISFRRTGMGMEAFRLATGSNCDPDLWLTALRNDVGSSGGDQVCLVVDDAHHLTSDVARVLGALSTETWVQVFVAGHQEPNELPSGATQYLSLGVADLAFSVNETSELFKGLGLSTATVEGLHAKTEGWAYALALARDLALLGYRDVLSELNPSRRELVRVFEEKVFLSLDEAEKDVVGSLAMLGALSLSQAQLLLGFDLAKRLVALSQRASFVLEERSEERAYRLHTLYEAFVTERIEVELGVEAIRRKQAEAARQLMDTKDVVKALDLAERSSDWDLFTGIVVTLIPHAPSRQLHRFLRRKLDLAPNSVWTTDDRLLSLAIASDLEWGDFDRAQSLLTVLKARRPASPFTHYLEMNLRLLKGQIGVEDLAEMEALIDELEPVDVDAAAGLTITKIDLVTRREVSSSEALIRAADELEGLANNTTLAHGVRFEAVLQRGWLLSRAFRQVFVDEITTLRIRTEAYGSQSVENRIKQAGRVLGIHTAAMDALERAAKLAPRDDLFLQARYLQTLALSTAHGVWAVNVLSNVDERSNLVDSLDTMDRAIDLWRMLGVERAAWLAITEKGQILLLANRFAEARELVDSALAIAEARGWDELSDRARAVLELESLRLGFGTEPRLASMTPEARNQFAEQMMEMLGIPKREQYKAIVDFQIDRLVCIDVERASYCRHMQLSEDLRINSDPKRAGREIPPAGVECEVFGFRGPDTTGPVQEPIAVFKGRFCLGCAVRNPEGLH